MTGIYNLWHKRLTGDEPLTHSLCSQGAKAIFPLSLGAEPEGKRTNLTRDEAVNLVSLVLAKTLEGTGIRVCDEDAAKGARWLAGGTPKRLGYDRVDVDLSQPTYWAGARPIGHHRDLWQPVYVASTTDGRQVQYVTVSWQTMAFNTLADVSYIHVTEPRRAA